MDFSKFGKVWNDPESQYIKKLIKTTCEGNSSKQKKISNSLVTFHKYEDGWGGSHSCSYHENDVKRQGEVLEVQLDRIDPEKKVIREWTKINCNTKKYSSGKFQDMGTGYVADMGYNYWYDYDIATADPCLGRLIDLVCM